jgi:hypothetical protein
MVFRTMPSHISNANWVRIIGIAYLAISLHGASGTCACGLESSSAVAGKHSVEAEKQRAQVIVADIVWDVEGTGEQTAGETINDMDLANDIEPVQTENGAIPEVLPSPKTPPNDIPATGESNSALLRDIQFSELLDPTGLDEDRHKRIGAATIVPDRDPYFGTTSRIRFMWTARNLSHRTLYFDDMPAERLGQTCADGIQPLASTCEFFKDFLLFPCRWPCDRCRKLHYTLGLPRPGSPSPSLRERHFPTH